MASQDSWAFGSGGFVKLYGDRLAQSSLLDRDVATRWAFVFILSQADYEGRYRCASIAGLARAAALTQEQAEKAVAELEAPDPTSTTPDHGGCRIRRIQGGWEVLNYQKYRDFRTERQAKEAERQRRWRAHKRDMSRDVTVTNAPDIRHQTPDNRQQTPDTRQQTPPPPPKGGVQRGLAEFVGAFNAAYDRRLGLPALNRPQQQQLRRLVESYGISGASCLPILAWAYDRAKDRPARQRAVSHLLHDGERGTFNWASLLETAPTVAKAGGNQTTEARLWRVADKLGLGAALAGFGCQRPEAAQPEAPPPTLEQVERWKAEGVARAKAEMQAALAAEARTA